MNKSFSKRAIKIVGITLLVYTVLVAPHEGEFWPFSIYPMFSQAGNPWTRAMVLDVTDKDQQEIWNRILLDSLQTEVVPVGKYGVDQIDFSNFVVKTDTWTNNRRQALITMFGESEIGDERWMVSKVRGKLIGQDSVAIEITPFIMITADTTFTNPNLPQSVYGGSN